VSLTSGPHMSDPSSIPSISLLIDNFGPTRAVRLPPAELGSDPARHRSASVPPSLSHDTACPRSAAAHLAQSRHRLPPLGRRLPSLVVTPPTPARPLAFGRELPGNGAEFAFLSVGIAQAWRPGGEWTSSLPWCCCLRPRARPHRERWPRARQLLSGGADRHRVLQPATDWEKRDIGERHEHDMWVRIVSETIS
jgi:hypothetical protein